MKNILQDARACVLFDVPYLYHATKTKFNGKIDYEKLMEYLTEDLGILVTKAIAFVLDTRNDETKGSVGFDIFIDKLEQENINAVIQKPRRVIDGKPAKTDCNLAIAVEAMAIYRKVDVVILGSGNGDFVYLAEKLKGLNVDTVVLGHKETVSKDLLASCHDIIEIGEDQLMDEGR